MICVYFRIFTNSVFIAVQVELAAQDPGIGWFFWIQRSERAVMWYERLVKDRCFQVVVVWLLNLKDHQSPKSQLKHHFWKDIWMQRNDAHQICRRVFMIISCGPVKCTAGIFSNEPALGVGKLRVCWRRLRYPPFFSELDVQAKHLTLPSSWLGQPTPFCFLDAKRSLVRCPTRRTWWSYQKEKAPHLENGTCKILEIT